MTAVIYTLLPADLRAAGCKFWLRSTGLNAASPFTGGRSVYGPISQAWQCQISSVPMERPNWQRFAAFFSRAAGMSGLIRVGDPMRVRPLHDTLIKPVSGTFSDGTTFDDDTGWVEGYLPPSLIVDEPASRDATSIVLSGLPASLAPALHAGDLVELRPNAVPADFGMLYEVANDAPTDASGKTRININPSLRAGVAAGDQAVLRNATSVFRAIDDDQGTVERMLPALGAVGYSLVEELP